MNSLPCPFQLTFILILAFTSRVASGQNGPGSPPRRLVIWERNFDEYDETLPLLRMILGDQYELAKSVPDVEFRRAVRMVAQNRGMDIVSVGTDAELESELHPIRWPTDKGILGYRVCLIRKDQQELFNRVHTLADLKKIKIGLSDHWPDTEILKEAGFTVVTTSRYENLFPMLANGRFDCFLRGIGEVVFELQKPASKDFIIEKRLLVHYNLTNFIFVRSSDATLIQNINQGFQKILANRQFDSFFRTFFLPRFRGLGLQKRVLFPVPSAHNSKETEAIWHAPGLMINPLTFPEASGN